MAASTGSPASRRSTKLTPLTTLPSFTSRQGMTRTLNIGSLLGRGAGVADQRQSRRRIEAPVIERTAGDRASKLFRPRRQQRFDVVDRGKTAGRNDGHRNALGECDGHLQIEALQQAVTGDIGEDDGTDAGILKALRNLKRGDF